MKILILGGTGAMGAPLVELLKQKEYDVYVTSRKENKDCDNIHYIQGNAFKNEFIESLLDDKFYDVIFDFTVCSTENFERKTELILPKTNQYFFFSSSRVYAESQEPITENSPRLLDVIGDNEYLETDEYALAKAREENILFNSGKNNWTIIRPYITYNDYRLQLGVYEKENWLNRVLEKKTVVLPKQIAESTTSLTFGPDVAKALVKLINNEKSYGQVFQVVTGQSLKWEEIFEIYSSFIEKKTGIKSKIKIIDEYDSLCTVWGKYQVKYDRVFNRKFDSSKLDDAIGKFEYTDIYEGLEKCISNFIDDPIWLSRKWDYEAWSDLQSNEWTKLSEIPGFYSKYRYLKRRLSKK